MIPKTTELIYELIDNIGVRSITDIPVITKKMVEKDFNLLFDQIRGIYQFVEDDIEALKDTKDVFKVIPGGYLNVNSEFSCDAIDCRHEALESACKKLILYADIICMNDLLLAPLTDIGRGITSSGVDHFEAALILLLSLRPLANEGMLLLYPDIGNWILCEKCLKRLISEAHIDLDKACDIFCKRNKVTLYREPDQEYVACFNFSDSDHHNLWHHLDAEDISKSLNSKLTRKDSDGRLYYHLPTQAAKEFNAIRSKVSKICLQLNWAATLAEKLEGSMVTDSFTEWDLISEDLQLLKPPKVENDFKIPFIDNLSIADLIAIRKSEPISFENFRLSLSKIKEEFSHEKSFSKKNVAYYIQNRIIPELNIIDEDLKRIKRRTLVKSVSASAIAGIFAAIGFYEGAYSPILFSALQQLGLLGIAFEGLHICSEHIQAQHEIKSRAPYFLWKAKTIKRKII